MKLSRLWLESWLGQALPLGRTLERLTLAGLEVDGVESMPGLDGIVVGRVTAVNAHPDADKLRVCDVDDGEGTLQIVCGAPNVRADMPVAVARIGSKLPGGLKIRKSKLRGVESHGMLCSASELGLGDDHDGIMELAPDLAPGSAVNAHMMLPDDIIDIDLTPNRGDCFSLLGVAREVATFSDIDFTPPVPKPVAGEPAHAFTASVSAEEGAPVFTTRVIEGIDPGAQTPMWMVERLRRSGIRSIHPVVDITNYVMLEYGQPMHGYDLDKLDGNIVVRMADGKEQLTLLDGREVTPGADTLVIADNRGAIGLAGIMGGLSTSVDENTRNIVFEAAFFAPQLLAGQARRYALHTDASLRFERGVDPSGQARAQQRAAALLLEIAGGKPSQVHTVSSDTHLPQRNAVALRSDRLNKVLGTPIAPAAVDRIFERLSLPATFDGQQWLVTPPGFRFDLAIEEDLIEEVARVYGYDRIPMRKAYAQTALVSSPETQVPEARVRDQLAARGFSEAITYSFVDPDDHAVWDIAPAGPELVNPISRELSVMRGTLLCGLVRAASYNLARQQSRVRLFEVGHVFGARSEERKIAGVVAGARTSEQWDGVSSGADFFDIKAEVAALLGIGRSGVAFEFRRADSACLHPGQSASIIRDDQRVGVVGALHPRLAARHDIDGPIFVFELDYTSSMAAIVPASEPIPRFPQVRRDIAVLVDDKVAAADILASVRDAGGELLHTVNVFDVYRGKGIEPGLKSVALGLILLDSSRTLIDTEADAVVDNIVSRLHQIHGAKLRE